MSQGAKCSNSQLLRLLNHLNRNLTTIILQFGKTNVGRWKNREVEPGVDIKQLQEQLPGLERRFRSLIVRRSLHLVCIEVVNQIGSERAFDKPGRGARADTITIS